MLSSQSLRDSCAGKSCNLMPEFQIDTFLLKIIIVNNLPYFFVYKNYVGKMIDSAQLVHMLNLRRLLCRKINAWLLSDATIRPTYRCWGLTQWNTCLRRGSRGRVPVV